MSANADGEMKEEVNEPDLHASPLDLLPNTSKNPDTSSAVNDHIHGRSNSILGINDKTNQDIVGGEAAAAVQGEDCEIDNSTKSTVNQPL